MKKKDYEKIELELQLKGYELYSYRGIVGWGCNLIFPSSDRYNCFRDIGTGYPLHTKSVFKEKTARKRMLKWYCKNRAVVTAQHLTIRN